MFSTHRSLKDQNAMQPQCTFCFKVMGTTVTFSIMSALSLYAIAFTAVLCAYTSAHWTHTLFVRVILGNVGNNQQQSHRRWGRVERSGNTWKENCNTSRVPLSKRPITYDTWREPRDGIFLLGVHLYSCLCTFSYVQEYRSWKPASPDKHTWARWKLNQDLGIQLSIRGAWAT